MSMNFRQAPLVVAVAALSLFAGAVSAQQRATNGPLATPRGLPQDWSNRHVVYRNPDTPQEAARKGLTEQWRRSYQDPRFVLALTRKLEAQATAKYASANAKPGPTPPPPSSIELGIHRDWSHVMGGGTDGLGGVGTAGVYPAKYSFDISAAPSCANDFVVYPTGTAGATVGAGTLETLNSTFSSAAAEGTITIGAVGGARSVTLTASTDLNAGLFFQSSATAATQAANLVAAVNRWSGTTGITAAQLPVIPGSGVRFSRTTQGNTVAIPITEALTNYSTGTTTGGTGSPGQPTIIAFNQLYNTTCNATRTNTAYPNVLFAYNTGTGAVVRTSPVISFYDNGLQIAFVQSNSSNQAQLVLLKRGTTATGTFGAPTVPPTAATAADYRNNTGLCATTAGCMYIMTFSGTPNVSFSSPYIDYSGDVAWVGADNGTLHKFTGVFSGTPAEVTTGGFPATVSAGNALSSPVYDFGGNQVFVGSARGAASGGMMHRVNETTGTVISSGQLAVNSSRGLRASPVLDSSADRAYAWVFNDGVLGDGVTCSATGNCQSVYQFDTAFTAGNTGTKARVGRGFGAGSLAASFFNGTFDDAYYTSATPTGNLYVCASAPNDASMATLWKIPITNNVMGTPVQGASVTSTGFTGDCSPVSEVKNGANEYLYMGLPDHATDGAAVVCGTGAVANSCLYMFNLNALGALNEQWVYTFTGGGALNNETITINGTVITATSVNTSAAPPYTFRSQGNGTLDGNELALVANAISGTTGISVSTVADSGVVTFTNIAHGNVADNLIVEALSAFSLTSHTDGTTGTGVAWGTSNVPSAGLSVFGGTGGIIMDNISATPGTSQVYFSNLGSDCDAATGGTQLCGNAYQASQSGLQ
jgi:hypothetical protein